MTIIRTPLSPSLPVSLWEVKEHCRVDGPHEDALIAQMITAATLELEVLAGLALSLQTITVTIDAPSCGPVRLPVGPVLAGALASVAVIGAGGVETAQAGGWWLEAGRRATLHHEGGLSGTRLRVTYAAGYPGGTVPADLCHAIADMVARMYDQRGGVDDKAPALSPHAARVLARYQRVGL